MPPRDAPSTRMFVTSVPSASVTAPPACCAGELFAILGAAEEPASDVTDGPSPRSLCPGSSAIPPTRGTAAGGTTIAPHGKADHALHDHPDRQQRADPARRDHASCAELDAPLDRFHSELERRHAREPAAARETGGGLGRESAMGHVCVELGEVRDAHP